MRENRTGSWFGILVLLTGVIYLMADLAQTFTMGISGWTTFFLLGGIWLFCRNRRNETLSSGN